jgi:hypothetical protein
MRREDLPWRPVGVTNPDLVLPCVAAGGVQLVERCEARRDQPPLGLEDLSGRGDLDARVVEGTEGLARAFVER